MVLGAHLFPAKFIEALAASGAYLLDLAFELLHA
jgi:hypothetical protein